MANTWPVEGLWGKLPETTVLTDGDRDDWLSVTLLAKQSEDQNPETWLSLHMKRPFRYEKEKENGQPELFLGSSYHIV